MRATRDPNRPLFGINPDPDAYAIDAKGLSNAVSGRLLFSRASGAWKAIERAVLAERDAGLGIWRYPADPNVVVFPVENNYGSKARMAYAYDERKPVDSQFATEGVTPVPGVLGDALAAYLRSTAQLPAWYEAQDGEIWVMTLKAERPPASAPIERTYHVVRRPDELRFFYVQAETFQPGFFPDEFTKGHRIWPAPTEETDCA